MRTNEDVLQPSENSSNEAHITRPKNQKKTENTIKFAPMGKLLNGNQAGNPNNAPRCGAKARSTGEPCRAPAMKNGKCRLHGGKSTGPRTEEGLKRSQKARWKHGDYSKRAIKIMDGYLWIDDELIKTRAAREEQEREKAQREARLSLRDLRHFFRR